MKERGVHIFAKSKKHAPACYLYAIFFERICVTLLNCFRRVSDN